MNRRFRPTDAFVDESIRGQRYLLGCVLVEARSLASTRLELNGLTEARRRIHFHSESPKRRREILAAIAEMPVSTVVFIAKSKQGVREGDARAACLADLVRTLQVSGVQRLVIESRQDDRADVAVIERARTREPRLVFEHRRPSDDPMLWIADAVTWAVGAGREWRDLIEPVLADVHNVAP
jgi:hypothetical protein